MLIDSSTKVSIHHTIDRPEICLPAFLLTYYLLRVFSSHASTKSIKPSIHPPGRLPSCDPDPGLSQEDYDSAISVTPPIYANAKPRPAPKGKAVSRTSKQPEASAVPCPSGHPYRSK